MTTNESLPMGDAVNVGWERFKENVPLLIAIQFLVFAIPGFLELAAELAEGSGLVEVGLWVAHLAVELTVELGLISIVLRVLDNQPVKFSNLFDVFDRVPSMFIAAFAAIILTLVGFVMLIIPGVIVAIRLQFIGYFVLEGAGPVDAIQRSWDLTRGYTFDLFLLGILLLAINILGFICLFIGLLATAPITKIAQAHVFRYLREREAATTIVPAQ